MASGTPPLTPEQAVELVRARYARPRQADGSPAELHVHEFDIGYLVYAVHPPHADPSGRPLPAPPGGANVVVSKETGETVTVPNLPTEQAVALYRRNLAHPAQRLR
ncbi:hypothetical protein CTU88_29870 [Streptomyces sp. JV178]|uniref:hypothetical protein n=1 Tax=Streptomyces sp. JV178 TaxID=858632 RepID=UPI000C1B3ADD|nr:hypothetical protein [Streptomyces sp. JV178]PIM69072.1 hypothetical protein CTU88_29870 [Streptomyces sp. JV178]